MRRSSLSTGWTSCRASWTECAATPSSPSQRSPLLFVFLYYNLHCAFFVKKYTRPSDVDGSGKIKRKKGKIWILKYFKILTRKTNMSWWTMENVTKKENPVPVHKEKYYWWVKPRELRERGKEERGSKVSRILIDNIRARVGECALIYFCSEKGKVKSGGEGVMYVPFIEPR